MSAGLAGGSPYLRHDAYWVPTADAAAYPVRQGDLFADIHVSGDEVWPAALIVHPTCELGKPSVEQVQVASVRALADIRDAKQQALMVAGAQEKGGVWRVAFAHTFFVAPVLGGPLSEASEIDLHAEPMWADLRVIRDAPRQQFAAEERAAAMTHDARVTLIRRYLYFRFRIALSFAEVRDLEKDRIAADPQFAGPRPDWAP